MAVLVLHDNPASSNALKVRFLLAELGLTYERRTVSLERPRPAEYLALNPMGGIPTLLDGDFALAESHAILRYLALREGREDLYPSDARGRPRVEEFLDRLATGLRSRIFRHEAAALGYAPEVGFHAVVRDPAAIAEAEAEVQPALTLLEDLVEAGRRYSGDSPSPTARWLLSSTGPRTRV